MSKKLDDEQKKYGEFYTNLKDISQAKQEGLDLASAKDIVNDYKSQLSLSKFIDFWKSYEADTPEETEVLEICKENIKYNVKVCMGSSYMMSLALTVVYASYIPLWPRFVIQTSGALIGGLYGVIISNKPNMARFYEMGPEYSLGRIARDEILQWSSDEEISKQEER